MNNERCEVCGWPLRARIEDGCVRGNCSMRPRPKPHTPLAEAAALAVALAQANERTKQLEAEVERLRDEVEARKAEW